MKSESSTIWRSTGDYAAFAPDQWRFQSHLYIRAAMLLRASYEAVAETDPFDAAACLVAGQFNASLALELIVKALYLKRSLGKPEEIYTHQISKLVPEGLLTEEQYATLAVSTQCVEWAGRYPTPKWDKEWRKEQYDVPELNGSIDASAMPNRAGIDRIDAMKELYDHIAGAWGA